MDGDFSDDIEEWKNELETVKTVWELCLVNWRHQLEKNKKVLEAEIDAGDGAVRDEVGDSSDSSSGELSEVGLGNVPPPRLSRIVLYLVVALPSSVAIMATKDEIKVETVEPPIKTDSVST